MFGASKKILNLETPSGFFAQHKLYNLKRLSQRIKQNEGYRNYIYRDSLGNPTIGYGHLVSLNDDFKYKKKYRKKTLNNLFFKDLGKAISVLKKNYKYKTLPTNVQEVIIEMIFQLGFKKIKKFKKFNLCIKKEKYYLAAFEMLSSLWYKQTPKRVKKLIFILLNEK